MLKILLFDLSDIKFSMAFQLSFRLQWKFQLNELQKFCYHEQRKKNSQTIWDIVDLHNASLSIRNMYYVIINFENKLFVLRFDLTQTNNQFQIIFHGKLLWSVTVLLEYSTLIIYHVNIQHLCEIETLILGMYE